MSGSTILVSPGKDTVTLNPDNQFFIDNMDGNMMGMNNTKSLDGLTVGGILNTTTETKGRKFDGGKLEYGLLPPLALEETVKVLTFGAQKYERDNWQIVPDAKRRYFDAVQRHMWAWKQGEQMDPESGIHHLAHAMCGLMFLYEHDIMYSLNNGDVNEVVK